jgi:hypothetical protein
MKPGDQTMTDQTVITAPRVTVEELYNLPVTPEQKPQKAAPSTKSNATIETTRPLEALWKPFGNKTGQKNDLRHVKTLHALTSPAKIREALGFSQSEFAKVLSVYLAKPVTPGAIGMYEYAFRETHHMKKYGPTANVVDAYRRIVEDAVAIVSDNHLRVKSRFFKTVWHFDLIGHCKKGDHAFTLKRSGLINCPRHAKRTRPAKKGVKRS